MYTLPINAVQVKVLSSSAARSRGSHVMLDSST